MTTQPIAATEAGARYYATFGFRHLPGALALERDELVRAFDQVLEQETAEGEVVPGIVERSDALGRILLAAGTCGAIARALLDSEPTYLGSEGVVAEDGRPWSRGRAGGPSAAVELVVVLDASADLRVIPGTHRPGGDWREFERDLADPAAALGLAPEEVPAVAVETEPGDVVALHPELLRATFRGRSARRELLLAFGLTSSSAR